MMSTRLLNLLPMATVALLATAIPARAAVILNFEAGAATPATGGTVSVPIYLRETLTGGSTSAIAPEGLFSIGVAIARTAGTATVGSLVRNAAFDQLDGGATSAMGASVNAEQNANFGNGVNPDVNGRILFATATITLGALPSQFSIADYGAGDQIVNYRFETLDSRVSPGIFTVAALPEPTTLAALAGVAVIAGRRRRSAPSCAMA